MSDRRKRSAAVDALLGFGALLLWLVIFAAGPVLGAVFLGFPAGPIFGGIWAGLVTGITLEALR